MRSEISNFVMNDNYCEAKIAPNYFSNNFVKPHFILMNIDTHILQ